MPPRYLFIAGCPRSGTTAMWRVLRESPQVVMGNEWFAARVAALDPSFYERERFLAPEPGGVDCGYDIHTHKHTRDYVPIAQERYDSALYVGDKIPYLYRHLDTFGPRFQGAKIVYMIRDIYGVANSYKHRQNDPEEKHWTAGGVTEAIRDWNASLAELKEYHSGISIMPVHYDRFFGEGSAHPLYEVLRIKPTREMIATHAAQKFKMHTLQAERQTELTATDIGEIADTADLDTYRALLAAHERMRWGGLPSVWHMV